MGTLMAICISEKRGTKKHPLKSAKLIANWGIEQDAHGGDWHRQVSLLSYDAIRAFKNRGANVNDGDFGENLICSGIDFCKLPIGTVIECGEALLEITQIGKECHTHCQIYQTMGECIMPTQGVFAKVLHGGNIHVGDSVKYTIC